MERIQDEVVALLCLSHGRLAVREGYEDGHVEATTPTGRSWKITTDGDLVPQRGDYSVDWNK
jgi:hypothetical protein